MKKALTKAPLAGLYYYKYGERVDGSNERMSGSCSGLSGDCTGLSGDLDACELTDEERKAGIDIIDLVSEE